MELNEDHEQLNYIEDDAIMTAHSFLDGWQDWNEHDVLRMACDYHGYDYDFCWLALHVLMAPAVVYIKTGKSV